MDYEEGRLHSTPAGHHQLATPLFLSPHDILKTNIQKELMKKDLEKSGLD
jgi:hypothetical protein